MEPSKNNQLSKFLSLVLRHAPETIGLTLDANGWANVDELLQKLKTKDFDVSLDELKALVADNNKQRFAFNDDCSRIRANQGHSVNVDLNLVPQTPPDILYHGTAEKNIESIKEKGLLKVERHHVHLSSNTDTAKQVGGRHGKPVVLSIDARQMQADGIAFYLSDNNVWLVDYVAPGYISIL